MVVAAPKGFRDESEYPLRVATKFVNIAQDYYSSKGRDIDIIKLNGSIEIAPILGLSDVIVDLVKNGNTLKYLGETSETGWLLVSFGEQRAWVSGKYGKLD